MKTKSFILIILSVILNFCVNQSNDLPAKIFTKNEFKSLQWLDGRWVGSGGNQPFYETYSLQNDSTIVIHYYGSDSTWSHELGTGSIYFKNGRIYHRYYEGGLWAASSMTDSVIYFDPIRDAGTTFSWRRISRHQWMAELQFNDEKGKPQKFIYEMNAALLDENKNKDD